MLGSLAKAMSIRGGGKENTVVYDSNSHAQPVEARSENAEVETWEARVCVSDLSDPLQPWCDYAKWARENCVSRELDVLQRVTHLFVNDPRFKDDVRYLRLWVRYASKINRRQRCQVFERLQKESIGTGYALFYEAWAGALEQKHKFKEATQIFGLGLQLCAEPVARLRQSVGEFHDRMQQREKRNCRLERSRSKDQSQEVEPPLVGTAASIEASSSPVGGHGPNGMDRKRCVNPYPYPYPYPLEQQNLKRRNVQEDSVPSRSTQQEPKQEQRECMMVAAAQPQAKKERSFSWASDTTHTQEITSFSVREGLNDTREITNFSVRDGFLRCSPEHLRLFGDCGLDSLASQGAGSSLFKDKVRPGQPAQPSFLQVFDEGVQHDADADADVSDNGNSARIEPVFQLANQCPL